MTVLCEYFTDAERTLVLIGRADLARPAIESVPLTREQLRANVQRVFGDSPARLGAIRDLTPEAWQLPLRPLLEPVARWAAPGETVWLVPHDVLHYLPLHAVDVEAQPLIERNPVCYSPSASVMKYCQERRTGRRSGSLVLGDPGGTLPNAREEAAAVATLLGGQAYCGERATKRTLLEEIGRRREQIDILHLACHGYFRGDEPMQSGIRLAPEPDTPDGVTITGKDVMTFDLRADLITVSACDSGLNSQRPGDDLIGLTRALLYAGTSSAVLSLWAVNDRSTGLLMRRFYEALLGVAREPLGKAAALRDAQLSLRRLTAGGLVAECERRLDTLDGDARLEARLPPLLDRAAAEAQAGDYRAASASYEEALRWLRNAPGATSDQANAVSKARRLCAFKAVDQAAPNYEVRPYDNPFYWAPFVLVGDWR